MHKQLIEMQEKRIHSITQQHISSQNPTQFWTNASTLQQVKQSKHWGRWKEKFLILCGYRLHGGSNGKKWKQGLSNTLKIQEESDGEENRKTSENN